MNRSMVPSWTCRDEALTVTMTLYRKQFTIWPEFLPDLRTMQHGMTLKWHVGIYNNTFKIWVVLHPQCEITVCEGTQVPAILITILISIAVGCIYIFSCQGEGSNLRHKIHPMDQSAHIRAACCKTNTRTSFQSDMRISSSEIVLIIREQLKNMCFSLFPAFQTVSYCVGSRL